MNGEPFFSISILPAVDVPIPVASREAARGVRYEGPFYSHYIAGRPTLRQDSGKTAGKAMIRDSAIWNGKKQNKQQTFKTAEYLLYSRVCSYSPYLRGAQAEYY